MKWEFLQDGNFGWRDFRGWILWRWEQEGEERRKCCKLATSMQHYCEDAEFRRLLPHFKIMILSIKHETLGSTLWLLFTNPANHCLLTAKHPLPRPTLQYTGLTLPSLHHISDCSHITRRFRDEINTELSKNGFFEGQKQASLAGWFQSRKHYLYCIVNKVVGSQLRVWKGGKR